MINKKNNKQDLWYYRNSINEKNIIHISKLLENKKIYPQQENSINYYWKEIVQDGDMAVLININDRIYKIVVSREDNGLILFERNKSNNFKNLEHYHRLYNIFGTNNGIFKGDDCWFDLVEFLGRCINRKVI